MFGKIRKNEARRVNTNMARRLLKHAKESILRQWLCCAVIFNCDDSCVISDEEM